MLSSLAKGTLLMRLNWGFWDDRIILDYLSDYNIITTVFYNGKEEDRVREGNGTMQAEIRGGG